MRSQWIEMAAAAFLVGAGCTALYLSLKRAMKLSEAEQHRETEARLSELAAAVKALDARMDRLDRKAGAGEIESISAGAEQIPEDKKETVKPEIVAAITAATGAMLGRGARVRTIKTLSKDESSAWSQQGRMIVHTSHNLNSR